MAAFLTHIRPNVGITIINHPPVIRDVHHSLSWLVYDIVIPCYTHITNDVVIAGG